MSSDENKYFVFRLNENGQGPEIVRQVFLERGWVEFDEDDQAEYDWNLWWRTSRFRTSDHDSLMAWQQLNHYPKSTAITKKDALARNMKRMKGVHGAAVFNFFPNAFNLPNDYTKFVGEYSRWRDKSPEKPQYWICKPADMSRGRGIFLFKDINELNYDCNAVVQTYIQNPLLIGGYKFDLRIYVVVPSFHPLNIYIYQEGLVRFGTEKFDLGCLKNVFSHLTNTSINKYSPSYTVDKEAVGSGCKWTMIQLRHYFRQANIDDSQTFIKIQSIVILTLLVQANQVPKYNNCFELYGFDIMIDENMKPWLLEVNFSPALATDSQVDIFVKKPMINDLIELVGFTEEDKERGGAEFKELKERQQQQNTYTSYIPPTGGRRSSQGFGPGKRNSTAATKRRNSKSRASSNLNASGGQRGSNLTLQLNTPRSSIADGNPEEVLSPTEVKPPMSPEQKVIPLIPGCGLPSVQQPDRTRKKNGHQRGVDSGHSSSDGSDCEPEDKIEKKPSAKGWRGSNSLNSTRSTQGNNDMPPVYRGKQPSSYVRSLNRITGAPRSSSLRPKGVSKHSLTSDSGLSSTSGSNSSDQMEPNARYEDGRSWSSKYRNDTSKTGTTRQQTDLHDAHGFDKQANTLNKLQQKTVYGKDEKSTVSRKGTATVVRPTQPNYRRKPVTFMSFKSQAERRTAHQSRGTSQTHSPDQNQRFLQTPASRLSRQKNHDKPWRKSKSQTVPTAEKPGTPRPSASNPRPRVGDFYLVFPFNEETHKCAMNGLDPRVVIKETQKMLKDRLASTVLDRGAGVALTRPDLHEELSRSPGYKGSSSARSSQRSLAITLVSEKTMLSNKTDPTGVVTAARSAKPRKLQPPYQHHGYTQRYSDIWAPVVVDAKSHDHHAKHF